MALVIDLGQSGQRTGLLQKPHCRPEDCSLSRTDAQSF